jgi:5'-methylthioinosine phosphorylase
VFDRKYLTKRTEKIMLAIIGGSGLTALAQLELTERMIVRTPYGEASGPLTFGKIAGVQVVFLARHGYAHTLAPHEVNYRANLWALHHKGAREIIAVNAVGGIGAKFGPGVLAVPDQIIDYTHSRRNTIFEGSEQPVVHIDFTHPYSGNIRTALLSAAKQLAQPIVDGGTYACTQGPRLESAAEVLRLERDGAHMVGMTGMPEASLARELGLEYASLAVVANWAAGRGDSAQTVSMDQIHEVLKGAMHGAVKVIEAAVQFRMQRRSQPEKH